MVTRLKLDLPTGKIEVEGEDTFVRDVYGDFKSQLIPRRHDSLGAADEIRNLVVEAQISRKWNEYQRAFILYQRALEECGSETDSSILADILQGMEEMEQAIEETRQDIPELQAAVEADKSDAEKRFHLGLALSKVGQEKKALMEYERALNDPDNLCKHCFRDLWNNIGWYHYRRGRYREALKWFELACSVADMLEELGSPEQARLGMENKVLTFCALKMEREAKATANEYIGRYGRLAWPERRALTKLNIDADMMYVETQQGVSESEITSRP